MANSDKPIPLNTSNPTRNFLTVVVVLVVFVLFLIGLSVAAALKYFEASQQTAIVVVIVLLPFAGLILATGFIYRHSQRLFALSKYENLILELMSPESQRRKLNGQVEDLATAMDISDEQLGDLRAAYILAEDLALRQIEQEKKQPLRRHVKVGDAEFDAVFISRDVLTFVEVTFLVTPHVSQEKIDAIFRKINTVQRNYQHIRKNSKFRLLLAVVTQMDASAEDELRSTLVEKFAETPVDVDIRFFDFENLQQTFTEE
jgi:phosphate/sulfate permease